MRDNNSSFRFFLTWIHRVHELLTSEAAAAGCTAVCVLGSVGFPRGGLWSIDDGGEKKQVQTCKTYFCLNFCLY